MIESIIEFETAKLAKKKGFDLPVNNWYNDTETDKNFDGTNILRTAAKHNHNRPLDSVCVSAPTQSLLQKWLREKHNLHIQVSATDNYEFPNKYIASVFDVDFGDDRVVKKILNDTDAFDFYEEALERAMYFALNIII